MNTPASNKNTRPEIAIIDTSKMLAEMVSRLETVKEFAFDTEYDSFKREYGFKLLLMQIYDGEKVYIIDPLALSDLSALWKVIENPSICKILYAGSEDIALLKKFGCQSKNLFDVQIAATLTNHPARNLGDLISALTDQQGDKAQQQSDWRQRPLTPEQIEYAANDVIHLIDLKHSLSKEVEQRQLTEVLAEENAALETIPQREHIPKLKPIHFKLHTEAWCDALLEMILLRDKIAQEMNLPPVRIVDTRFLEEALDRRDAFLSSQDLKSFHPKVRNNPKLRSAFLAIVRNFDPNNNSRRPRERNAEYSRKPYLSKEQQLEIIQEKYEPVKNELVERYGELTAEFLLRGLKKDLTSLDETPREMREYQRELLGRMRG